MIGFLEASHFYWTWQHQQFSLFEIADSDHAFHNMNDDEEMIVYEVEAPIFTGSSVHSDWAVVRVTGCYIYVGLRHGTF